MRKRLTEIAPWLLPLRKKQRCFCFYMHMRHDGRVYSSEQTETNLPYLQYRTMTNMYNENTGFDMKYQENKVHNLQIAAMTMQNLVIRPQETFSFWQRVRHAGEYGTFRDGLVVVDGKLTTAQGGGLCQLSNLLFDMFLHSPLSIVERHGHMEKDFPDPDPETVCGTDATVSEGWLDLKVKNETDHSFQVSFLFEGRNLTGILRTDDSQMPQFSVRSVNVWYEKAGDGLYEHADVYRDRLDDRGGIVHSCLLYHNRVKLGYDPALYERRKHDNGRI